jgi:hypothetical protein
MPKIFQSFIQGDFGDDHGNFEAVILEGNKLIHWFRDNSSDLSWKRGQIVVEGQVAGAGSIIQSDFKSSDHGNFEVIVPLMAHAGRLELWHYWHDNSDVSLPWQRGQRITNDRDQVAGPGAIIQSDFNSEDHGNFEVVVPLYGPNRGTELWHFWHNNSDVNLPWQRGQRITGDQDRVAGPASIIQSDFKEDDHGNFEVVVPLYAANGQIQLWHFWHNNSDVNLSWQRGQMISANVSGPGVIIQSDFVNGNHGNFEVVVPEGHSLVHYWHDNSDVTMPWQRGQTITDSAHGWGCLTRSDFGGGEHSNFEVLVEECKQSVVSYWHPNQDVNLPWLRHRVLIGEPYPRRLPSTRKIVQLTGEFDREGWNGKGNPPFAHNRTQSRFGIRGTDLGVSFMHKDRVYFLFGDTWRVNQSDEEIDLDSIAFCTDTDAANGLSLTFYKQPPLIRGGISQRGFEVPLDGVSVNDTMYVFFSTDHCKTDGYNLMGRSVLTRSDNDGYDFDLLYEFSRFKFINVSIERATLDAVDARMLGLPLGTDVLWIWGSGRYRSSDVYLAVMPLEGIETRSGVWYFAGDREHVQWSDREDDATALFCAGDVGELSVRWNQFLRRYLALFNSGNPRGILMYSAPKPWGTWSAEPVMIFDPGFLQHANNPCSGDGNGRFMHIDWRVRVCDHVQDDMFDPNNFRDNENGGEYGPYQITRYTTGIQDQWTQIYFTMSTWNPYQSLLMTTLITSDFV